MNEAKIKEKYLKLNQEEKNIKSFLDNSYYDSKTQKFISRWLNPERLQLEIYLREVYEYHVTGSLKNITEWFEIWKTEFPETYELTTSYVSYSQGCGDYKHVFELSGLRYETDEEYALRQKLLCLCY